MTDEEGGDRRPRVYVRASSPDAEVEVTVRGAPDETAEDISEVAGERLDDAVDQQARMAGEDDEEVGVQ